MPYSRSPATGNAAAARYIFACLEEGCTHLSIKGLFASLKGFIALLQQIEFNLIRKFGYAPLNKIPKALEANGESG